MTGDRISALLLFVFCLAYGVFAYDIELYAGSEDEVFTARTFPIVLAWTGGVISLLLIVLPPREDDQPLDWRALDWPRALALCVLMVLYGLTIQLAGFLTSTTLFLAASFYLLGERNGKVLVIVPIAVAAAFQFVLHGLLDIYIADPLLQAAGITG